jgi:hypothetical protein
VYNLNLIKKNVANGKDHATKKLKDQIDKEIPKEKKIKNDYDKFYNNTEPNQ